ncbi:MAG: hypothetical protein IJB46_09755, partial [Prevotella sp.]|nr:hypothetical protein [Prevotella sp.]
SIDSAMVSESEIVFGADGNAVSRPIDDIDEYFNDIPTELPKSSNDKNRKTEQNDEIVTFENL